jgi:hypothetical protein
MKTLYDWDVWADYDVPGYPDAPHRLLVFGSPIDQRPPTEDEPVWTENGLNLAGGIRLTIEITPTHTLVFIEGELVKLYLYRCTEPDERDLWDAPPMPAGAGYAEPRPHFAADFDCDDIPF